MDTREAITVEQARFIHGNHPPAVIGGTGIVLIVAFVFFNVVPRNYLVAWVAAVVVLSAFRMWTWHSYRKRPFTLDVARAWLRLAVTGAALSGVLWGIGSLFLIPPGEIAYQLMFLWAVSMMAVAAMFSFSSHVPTYMAYFLPSTLPALVVLLWQGTIAHTGFVLGMAVYIVIVVRFVSTYNRMFIETQKLRFENLELVGQLTEQIGVAKSANLAKSRFLAAASHDLRQPMHALNLYLGGLAGMELSAQAKAALANATECGRTMDGMFRALLDISKLDAGAMQAEPRAFRIAPLLERIRLEVQPQVHGKGLELRVAPCSAVVRADPAFVERILRNLTSNAVRYTASGRILIGCRRRGAALRVAVYDTGAGIAAEHQRHVFEEFYQTANPERDRAKGMGLGLAIVERLAQLMQAPVSLASTPGRGSVFAVDLPLAAREDGVPGAPVSRAGIARRSIAGSLVVVIDDEEAILRATRALLEQWGCTVVTAASGSDAMQQLIASPRAPDAIVCDYRLRGGESGLAVIDTLRAEFNADIPALLVTGDTGPGPLRELQASGVDVLHKPLEEKALRDALSRLIGVQAQEATRAA